MPSTDIEQRNGFSELVAPSRSAVETLAPSTVAQRMIRGWAMTLADAHAIAEMIVPTPFCPDSYRPRVPERADAVQRNDAIEVAVKTAAVAIMHGASLGFDPTASMLNIYMVSGRPGLYAEAMVALVKSVGHQIWVEDSSDTRVVVCGRRLGEEHVERVVVTMDQAKRAGWTRNAKYQAEPETMLYARAASKTCRRIAPDVLRGMAAVEEMQDGQEQGDSAAPVTSSRTVRRAALPAAPRVEDDRPALPGEDVVEEKPAAKPAAARVNKRGAAKPPEVEAEVEDVRPPLPDEEPPVTNSPSDPTPITEAQSRKMHASFRECQIGTREDGLAYVYDLIKREIASTSEMTKDEASRVIDSLERLANARRDLGQVHDAELLDGDMFNG